MYIYFYIILKTKQQQEYFKIILIYIRDINSICFKL